MINLRIPYKFIVSLTLIFQSLSARADTVDNYQLYIKRILLVTESGYPAFGAPVKFPVLDESNYNDTLMLVFNHCTVGAMNKRLQLISKDGRLLYEWKYPLDDPDSLSFPVYAILDNKQVNTGDTLKLVYYDSQSPHSVSITFLQIGKFQRNEMFAGKVTTETGFGWYVLAIGLVTALTIFLVVRKTTKWS